MIEVTLSWTEVRLAAEIGVLRQAQNLAAGRDERQYYGCSKEHSWEMHIIGALGECALAKYLGVYWGVTTLREPDVAGIQVRTRSRRSYDLILHPADSDDDRFVLVRGTPPTFELAGWCFGRDGKRPEFWRDPAGGRPAFFVPATALVSVEALRDGPRQHERAMSAQQEAR